MDDLERGMSRRLLRLAHQCAFLRNVMFIHGERWPQTQARIERAERLLLLARKSLKQEGGDK